MTATPRARAELFATLPPDWPDDPLPAIRALLGGTRAKVVVLDDDPTGTQTVHDIPVLTGWAVAALRHELESDLSAFYILTNSRSLIPTSARSLTEDIGRNLALAAAGARRPFHLVSRSDSTLRGHFPLETEALARSQKRTYDATLLIPAFIAGGRYTVDDVHYVQEGAWLWPAGASEFANDTTFGYRASNLRAWVEEKTAGRVAKSEVVSVSLEDIRCGGPEGVTRQLLELSDGDICVVNAASERDLEVVALAALGAERSGKDLLYRTAASFARALAGIAPRDLLTPHELDLPEGTGGLIVVGSHVPKTTAQVTVLEAGGIRKVELHVPSLLDAATREEALARAVVEVETAVESGEDTMLITSRTLVTGTDAGASLDLGHNVSAALVQVVRALSVRPRYVLAKGGITSSDLATAGLGVKRALVKGQIAPGIPVWELDHASCYPGLVYIVFPGNVGDEFTLAEVVSRLGKRGGHG